MCIRDRFLEQPLGMAPRVLLLIATLLLVFTYVFPLWQLTMFAPQYPEGLRMDIYSYRLEGGNKGQDVKEINILNHYIGTVSYTHLRAHETRHDLVCRLLLEKK